ncbi:DCN1-like protein 3 isoform X1 [Mastomys coucha]|uniref:DCN1-like protein 3 isoform X1 n=1 Tax=Mastomys coucha TaxID=35658 RepID=UPI0012628A62|nr:DCN1-like protein 3 isoform X1 [Mastomys coucha]XP_031243950.1 DCN1-like protein 3 isoform X1 [Mastomys coucha]XP_031243951.1 DCN1-like protein 3 isoform X1 [Mastomys coucha]XP_031243952.1 DCN1-like protein 3 isoform X1 [Mastomys coucha]XP_031243953.1 DCN1-like protein 3 isoform X1 [Mastomys coucha]XP_031243954.1 DCN1-like protein 3 isoform X1 [Mastomys coucha]
MGQCVTKCKNPSSTLGSKNGDRDPSSKSHSRRGASHREEQVPPCGKPAGDILVNGTKKAEAATEACQLPTSSGDAGRESKTNAEESSLQRLEELFRRYKDEREDAILEEGMERFCNDLCVDPTEFRVLLLAWKFQAATMCKFTRLSAVGFNKFVYLTIDISAENKTKNLKFPVSKWCSGWMRTPAGEE